MRSTCELQCELFLGRVASAPTDALTCLPVAWLTLLIHCVRIRFASVSYLHGLGLWVVDTRVGTLEQLTPKG